MEKDLGNSIKDWNDILPAVLEIEALYASLDQKENEKEGIKSELETLRAELEKEKTSKEKEDLKKLIALKEREVLDLRAAIDALKSRASTAASTLTSSATTFSTSVGPFMIPAPSVFAAGRILSLTTCKNCGKTYEMRALGENGLCNECNAKHK